MAVVAGTGVLGTGVGAGPDVGAGGVSAGTAVDSTVGSKGSGVAADSAVERTRVGLSSVGSEPQAASSASRITTVIQVEISWRRSSVDMENFNCVIHITRSAGRAGQQHWRMVPQLESASTY